MPFKVEQVRDLGPAPAVDALVIIANDAKVSVFAGEEMNQIELSRIGILIFINHHVTELVAAGGEHIGMIAKQLQGKDQQIVEIDRVARAQSTLVARQNVFGERFGTFIGESSGFDSSAFEPADETENGVGIDLFAFRRDLAQKFFHNAELFGFVVDHEIFLVAEFLDVLAENSGAERMKGRNRWPSAPSLAFGRSRTRHQLADALLHFARGFVGECNGKNLVARNSPCDHVRDPIGDDARFARARARQDQHWPIDGLNRKTLLRIEAGQVDHCTQILRREEVNTRRSRKKFCCVRNFLTELSLRNRDH